MVAAAAGISTDEALSRLRRHAFANGRHLAEVARDVVERGLRLSQPARQRAAACGRPPARSRLVSERHPR